MNADTQAERSETAAPAQRKPQRQSDFPIARAQAGDRDALAELTRLIRPHVEKQLGRYPVSDEDRHDLVQSTLLQVVPVARYHSIMSVSSIVTIPAALSFLIKELSFLTGTFTVSWACTLIPTARTNAAATITFRFIVHLAAMVHLGRQRRRQSNREGSSQTTCTYDGKPSIRPRCEARHKRDVSVLAVSRYSRERCAVHRKTNRATISHLDRDDASRTEHFNAHLIFRVVINLDGAPCRSHPRL